MTNEEIKIVSEEVFKEFIETVSDMEDMFTDAGGAYMYCLAGVYLSRALAIAEQFKHIETKQRLIMSFNTIVDEFCKRNPGSRGI